MDSRRLATPGVVLLFVGILVTYWGLGIFRGEGKSVTKRMLGPIGNKAPALDDGENMPSGAGGAGFARVK